MMCTCVHVYNRVVHVHVQGWRQLCKSGGGGGGGGTVGVSHHTCESMSTNRVACSKLTPG